MTIGGLDQWARTCASASTTFRARWVSGGRVSAAGLPDADGPAAVSARPADYSGRGWIEAGATAFPDQAVAPMRQLGGGERDNGLASKVVPSNARAVVWRCRRWRLRRPGRFP